MSAGDLTRYLHRDLEREPYPLPLVSQVLVAETETSWFLHVYLQGVRIRAIEVPARLGPAFLDRIFPPEVRAVDLPDPDRAAA